MPDPKSKYFPWIRICSNQVQEATISRLSEEYPISATLSSQYCNCKIVKTPFKKIILSLLYLPHPSSVTPYHSYSLCPLPPTPYSVTPPPSLLTPHPYSLLTPCTFHVSHPSQCPKSNISDFLLIKSLLLGNLTTKSFVRF